MKLNLTLTFILLAASTLLATSLSSTAYASRTRGYYAAGIILGEPTGFTGKYWTEKDRAIDAGLAFSFNDFFMTYGDYLFHFPITDANQSQFIRQLSPYVGAGLSFIFSTNSNRSDGKLFTENRDTFGLGIRFPLGIEWQPAEPPLGIYIEIAPGMGVIPKTFGFMQGGIGGRYYF